MLDNDEKRAKVLESLIEKRKASPSNDDTFFSSLDKVERALLTNIHFGIYKVSEEDTKLLAMK